MASIFETLSEIDVSGHVLQLKKGKDLDLDYLPWMWAYVLVKKEYPDTNFKALPDEVYADGSIIVGAETSIKAYEDGEIVEESVKQIWLAVTDNSLNAIPNPSSDDVSDTRMRAVVKSFALQGLGWELYTKDGFLKKDPPKKSKNPNGGTAKKKEVAAPTPAPKPNTSGGYNRPDDYSRLPTNSYPAKTGCVFCKAKIGAEEGVRGKDEIGASGWMVFCADEDECIAREKGEPSPKEEVDDELPF